MKISVNNLLYELELEAEVSSYNPPRPAPACQNHDDPAFSDSGDDEEIEYRLFIQLYTKEKKLIRIPLPEGDEYKELVTQIYRSVDDEVREKARDAYDKNLKYSLEVA